MRAKSRTIIDYNGEQIKKVEVKIFFSDLSEKAQKELLSILELTDDRNVMDIFPLTTIDFDTEECEI